MLDSPEELCDLLLAPQERARCERQVRCVKRSERWKPAVADLEEAVRPGEVLEAVLPEIEHVFDGAEQVTRRPRQNDLPAMCRRRDAGGPVHVQADVALSSDDRLTGVKPDVNANRSIARVVADGYGSRSCIRGSRECGEERVALSVHLDTGVFRKRSTNDSAVLGEEIRVRVAMLAQKLRRAYDVREEERDGAARKVVSHVSVKRELARGHW